MMTPRKDKKAHIKNYSSVGWSKVCVVKDHYGNWFYEKINKSIMFSSHNSWVYCITLNGYIEKIGESGQPLGLVRSVHFFDQPKSGSECRLGRYICGDNTDRKIRDALRTSIKSGELVEFWAAPCPESTVLIEGIKFKGQVHKQYEKALLDRFKNETGSYPRLNAGRA